MADLPTDDMSIASLMDEMLGLRSAVVSGAADVLQRFPADVRDDAALVNLAHYLALRHHDLKGLQRQLMWRGLSSLGRLESRVLPTLDSVLAVLAKLNGRDDLPSPSAELFFAGEARLSAATEQLFGQPPDNRYTHIMVTLPSEAATDAAYVADLARRGMGIARINCAHDDHDAWRAMAANARRAGEAVGRDVTVLMDIAGPKIRTEKVIQADKKARIVEGDVIRLVASGLPQLGGGAEFSATVSLPERVTRLSVGDRVRYDDGKLEAIVDWTGEGEAMVRVLRAKTGGAKLKPEKGINLPDTALGLSPLTSKDEADLASVIECADMIGYSFVSRPEDIDLLEAALSRHSGRKRPLGLIAKIERPEAILKLPDLIARAAGKRPFGVMIARGDLAAEIGFERLAEMQEEILWICEAAAVPVIWATQVLESLIKDGIPSRGEMTDAAMSSRAECVMLNKGAAVGQAIEVLGRLLTRMDANMAKKTPVLRALKSW